LALGVILLALLTVTLTVTRPAGADTIVATVTNDSGPGSLRQAIHDANGNPGPDTITFQLNSASFWYILRMLGKKRGLSTRGDAIRCRLCWWFLVRDRGYCFIKRT
jgi:hypothetical protein